MINTENKVHGKFKYKLITLALAFIITVSGLTGCSAASSQTDGTATAASVTADATSGASKSEMFTDRDLSGEYDEEEAVTITLDGTTASANADGSSAEAAASGVKVNGGTITITEEGTYIVTGTLSDGQIIVDADDTAKIQIVLKDASVTSKTSAALYVKSANKVFVTTAQGSTNTLSNGGSFTAIDESNIDGAVFAKADITFNGAGTLNISSPSKHGIVGKDDVKLAGGTINIDAGDHGVQAQDSVRVAEATITIKAVQDGIHVSDNSDEEEGTESDSFFYIADGSVTIEAGDDGIHADAEANIEGGNITVTESYEALEALEINISGGSADLTASDDGINAAGGNTNTTGDKTFGSDDWGGGMNDGGSNGTIVISGGAVKIQAGGDGIDSNGSIEITGGTTIVEGPTQGDTSVLDFNTTGTISGGTFIGTGASGMAQNFNSAENQGLIAVTVGNQNAGQTVKLKDSSGNVIAEVTPDLDYAVVYISTPDMKQGETYTLTAGTYSESIELTDLIYSTVSGGFGGGMGESLGGQHSSPPAGNRNDQSGSQTDANSGATANI